MLFILLPCLVLFEGYSGFILLILFISERTVNDHIASIYRKFSVRKRAEFMALFVGK